MNKNKLDLLDFTQEELEKFISPKFRIKQLMEWIYEKYIDDFNNMSSLPISLRQELDNKFYFNNLECIRLEKSLDNSIKYLFKLKDNLLIESVLLVDKKEKINKNEIPINHNKYTICISSQVGCKSGCTFCLTAKGGLKRNLSAGEIIGQVLWIKKHNNITYNQKINIVFMGMGEPLDNLENVTKAVRLLNDNLGISPRHQTISTSGLSKQIEKLGQMNLGVLLAISLHAVNDELRSKLMPINKAYNISSIINAVKNFPINQRKKIMFEYLLIDGINDSLEHAKILVKLLNGIKAKINLILFNPHENSIYKRPDINNVIKFQNYLKTKALVCTIRKSKGLDISAACGQLKERVIKQ